MILKQKIWINKASKKIIFKQKMWSNKISKKIIYNRHLRNLYHTIEFQIQKNQMLSNLLIKRHSIILKNSQGIQVVSTTKFSKTISSSSRIAIIATERKSIGLLNNLLSDCRGVDAVTLSPSVENFIRENYFKNFNEIFILQKKYSRLYSDIEVETVQLYDQIEEYCQEIMEQVLCDALGGKKEANELNKALMRAFKNRLFVPLSQYFSFLKLLNDYNFVIFYVNNINDPWTKALIEISRSSKNKTNFVFMSKKTSLKSSLALFHDNPDETPNEISQAPILNEIQKQVESYWKEIDAILNSISLSSEEKKFIPLCLHMNNRNYAYYPSGKEVAEAIILAGYRPLLVPYTILKNNFLYDWYKIAMEDGFISSGAQIYDFENIKKQVEIRLIQKEYYSIAQDLYQYLSKHLAQIYPVQIMVLIDSTIKLFCHGLNDRLLFACDMNRILEKAPVSFMVPERTDFARILAAISNIRQKPSIAVQQSIISDFPRYDAPIVTNMGVMDTMQKKIYMQLGYPEDKITLVGSANLRARFKLLKKYQNCQPKYGIDKSLLFIMQHSHLEQMKMIYSLLKEFVKDKNFILTIKPHPNQEGSLIDYIKNDIHQDPSNIILVDNNADTYEIVYQSDIVIGYFSSVLLESAIYANKKVLIITQNDLSETTDFSKNGLAIKSFPEKQEVQIKLQDLLTDGPLSQLLDETRLKFQQANAQLYNEESGINYIRSFLR
jgi:hypothetical protein